jgi:hypothetical protein
MQMSAASASGRSKALLLALLGAAAMFPTSALEALPLAKNPSVDALVVPTADGCGFNRYRDAGGKCRRLYVSAAHQRHPSFYSACGGVDSHRVCNWFGQCWMVCD